MVFGLCKLEGSLGPEHGNGKLRTKVVAERLLAMTMTHSGTDSCHQSVF